MPCRRSHVNIVARSSSTLLNYHWLASLAIHEALRFAHCFAFPARSMTLSPHFTPIRLFAGVQPLERHNPSRQVPHRCFWRIHRPLSESASYSQCSFTLLPVTSELISNRRGSPRTPHQEHLKPWLRSNLMHDRVEYSVGIYAQAKSDRLNVHGHPHLPIHIPFAHSYSVPPCPASAAFLRDRAGRTLTAHS